MKTTYFTFDKGNIEVDVPEFCPITGLPFFVMAEHPENGWVPTYGGPFDSYTIPELNSDGDYEWERCDWDRGDWIEGYEVVPESLIGRGKEAEKK